MQPVDPQYGAIVVLVGIQFLVSIAANIATVVSSAKRKPPLDQEMYRDFVRRVELDVVRKQFCDEITKLDTRHEKTAAEIFHVLRTLKDDIGNQSRHIEASLNSIAGEVGVISGRVQGHIEAEKKNT